jgi:hypothetical protein
VVSVGVMESEQRQTFTRNEAALEAPATLPASCSGSILLDRPPMTAMSLILVTR